MRNVKTGAERPTWKFQPLCFKARLRAVATLNLDSTDLEL